MQGWLAAAAAAATTAASAMQERAASAASAVQERLEDEKEGFLAEFQRCSAAAATAAHPAAGAPVGEALSLSGGAAASSGSGALGRFKRVGMTLLNPLADQDSVSANARAIHSSGVVMLPWEQPGLSPDVRARMRRASQDRTIFLAPPACLVDLNPPFVFSLEASVHIVLEALSVDKRLEAQRHALVPKVGVWRPTPAQLPATLQRQPPCRCSFGRSPRRMPNMLPRAEYAPHLPTPPCPPMPAPSQVVSEELFFFHYFAHLHALSTGAIPAVDTPPGGLSLASAEVRSDAESSAVVVSNSSGSEATEVRLLQPAVPRLHTPTLYTWTPVRAGRRLAGAVPCAASGSIAQPPFWHIPSPLLAHPVARRWACRGLLPTRRPRARLPGP